MQELTFRAMGCQMLAVLDCNSPEVEVWLNEVPTWFETWEEHLSRFRPNSELSLVNAAGGSTSVSPVLAEVLGEALISQRLSGGLVNPTLLNDLEEAGYDRNFGDLPRQITGKEVPQPAQSSRELKLDIAGRQLTLPHGSRLDLGGVAKGWSADKAAELLGQKGPALVDAGGDLAASAPQQDGSPWPIGVQNPLDPAEQLDLVLLANGGVATSGRDFRRWQVNGRWQHHIIDPRTGRPAQTDVLSATVVGPSARSAETAAKSVLILGSLAGLRWLDQRPDLAGLVVLEDGSAIPSRGWLDQIWR